MKQYLYVAFEQYNGGDLTFTRSENHGLTWLNPKPIVIKECGGPLLSVLSNTKFVYVSYLTATSFPRMMFSDDFGATFVHATVNFTRNITSWNPAAVTLCGQSNDKELDVLASAFPNYGHPPEYALWAASEKKPSNRTHPFTSQLIIIFATAWAYNRVQLYTATESLALSLV